MASITNCVKSSGVLAITPEPGDEVLIVCPGYWGKGKSVREAIGQLEWAFDPKRWVVYSVTPATVVNGMGLIARNRGDHPPVELARAA